MKAVLITGACINTGVAIVEKFASKGYNVIFTGRNSEKVHAAEKIYREKFPTVEIIGYHIDSLLDDRTVDEASVEKNVSKVPSRFTPIGDVAVGEDVADAVWYFAAHARNTTGAELVVDGGNTIQLYPIIPAN